MKSALSAWSRSKPLIIGHRGASAAAPENTLAAFELAREQGADGIEFDAKLTRDGAVVIHHDRTLNRTTDGSGPLAAYGLDELKALDAGSFFNPMFKHERIPTLEEVIGAAGDDLLLNIELTNYAHTRDALPDAVVAIVRKHRLQERVLLSSFNPIALRRVRSLAPALLTGLLVMPQQPAFMRAYLRRSCPHDAYHPHHSMLNERATAKSLSHGPVNVWTVNEEQQLMRCVELRVSGIITDQPDHARMLVNRFLSSPG